MSAPSAVDELDDLLTLEVPEGLVGIPEATRYSLTRWGGDGSPFALLEADGDDELAFVVVPAPVFFPDYEPVVDDEVVAGLELRGAEDAVVLVIVTVGEPVERSTANLLGPIVVNRRTHRAAQVVLSPEEHGTQHPLLPPVAATG